MMNLYRQFMEWNLERRVEKYRKLKVEAMLFGDHKDVQRYDDKLLGAMLARSKYRARTKNYI